MALGRLYWTTSGTIWETLENKWKTNGKTMVGFGRTELSLSLSCTEFRALSHGHGFRGPCFNGVRKTWVFHDFWIVCIGPLREKYGKRWKINGKPMENQWKTKEKRGGAAPWGPRGPPSLFLRFPLVFHCFCFTFPLIFQRFPIFWITMISDNHGSSHHRELLNSCQPFHE